MRIALCLLALAGSAWAETRIVSVGGAVTETIFALGAEESVVGVDTSSVFPEKAQTLPQVGYQRTLSAEGILSLKPDLVILAATAGPPSAIGQLKEMGVPLVHLQEGYTLEAATARIRKIGEALGRGTEAEELCKEVERDAAAVLPPQNPPPRVLFVMSAGGGAPMVAGSGTAADAVIQLSGGKNVGSDFSGYKLLSPEALVTLDPEILVTTSRTVQGHASGELLQGLSLTTAGKTKRLVVMDDLYLLGFGPRTGAALAEFSRKLASCRMSAER